MGCEIELGRIKRVGVVGSGIMGSGVAEVAAHGIPSRELESEAELKIAVVRKAGAQLTAEALARFVNETAPYFFVPRYIEFLDALPHTPTGRVQKYKLRARGVTPDTWDAVAAGFRVTR